jgi:DNA-binding transcriptional regulator YhcF (GntR family)
VLETQRGVGTFVKDVGNGAASQAERERELMALADRFLGESAALGFNAEEAVALLKIRYLQWKRGKSNG